MKRISKTEYVKQLIERAEKLASQGDKKSMCLLHLLDLKRAGHSPTRTELAIEAQYGRFVPVFDPHASVYRSSSDYDG
jgi:hypothetical protein